MPAVADYESVIRFGFGFGFKMYFTQFIHG